MDGKRVELRINPAALAGKLQHQCDYFLIPSFSSSVGGARILTHLLNATQDRERAAWAAGSALGHLASLNYYRIANRFDDRKRFQGFDQHAPHTSEGHVFPRPIQFHASIHRLR